MAIFKKRLPSNQDLLVVFAVCAFVIFVWSIINVLQEIPAWILRLNTWDLIGIVAYTQMFALIETVVVFLALVFLGMILPAALLRNKFAAQASMIVLVSSAWVILAHYNDQIIGAGQMRQLAFWTVVYVTSLALFYGLIQRYKKLEELVCAFGQKTMVLSFLYATVGLFSAVIVIVRNI